MIQRGLRRVKIAAKFSPAPARDLKSLLKSIGVKDLATHRFTGEQVAKLVEALRKNDPMTVDQAVGKITGNTQFSEAHLGVMIQSYLDFLPPRVVKELMKHGKIEVEIVGKAELGDALGSFDGKNLRLNGGLLKTQARMRRTIFHELTHWVHLKGPASYRKAIRNFMRQRMAETSGTIEPLHSKPGKPYPKLNLGGVWVDIVGIRDHFADMVGNEYAGMVYPDEMGNPEGREIPTTRLEMLALEPGLLAAYLNHQLKDSNGKILVDSNGSKRYPWRESFLEAANILLEVAP